MLIWFFLQTEVWRKVGWNFSLTWNWYNNPPTPKLRRIFFFLKFLGKILLNQTTVDQLMVLKQFWSVQPVWKNGEERILLKRSRWKGVAQETLFLNGDIDNFLLFPQREVSQWQKSFRLLVASFPLESRGDKSSIKSSLNWFWEEDSSEFWGNIQIIMQLTATISKLLPATDISRIFLLQSLRIFVRGNYFTVKWIDCSNSAVKQPISGVINQFLLLQRVLRF